MQRERTEALRGISEDAHEPLDSEITSQLSLTTDGEEGDESFFDAVADESFYQALLHPIEPKRIPTKDAASGLNTGTSGDALFATIFSADARNDGPEMDSCDFSNVPEVTRAQTLSSPELYSKQTRGEGLLEDQEAKQLREVSNLFKFPDVPGQQRTKRLYPSASVSPTRISMERNVKRPQRAIPEFAGSRFDPRALGVLNIESLIPRTTSLIPAGAQLSDTATRGLYRASTQTDAVIMTSTSHTPSLGYKRPRHGRRQQDPSTSVNRAVTPHILFHARRTQEDDLSSTIVSTSLSPNARMILDAAAVPRVETMAEMAHSSLTVFTAMALEQKRRLLRSWWYRYSLLIFKLRYLVAILFIGAFIPVLVALLGHKRLTASVRPLIPSHVDAADAYFKLYDDFGPSKGLEYTLVVGAPETGNYTETCLTNHFWKTTHKNFAKFAYFSEPQLSLSNVGGPLYLDSIAVPFPLIKWARGDLLQPVEQLVNKRIDSAGVNQTTQAASFPNDCLDYLADVGGIPGGAERLRYFLEYEIDMGFRHAEAELDDIIGKGVNIASSWLGNLLNITVLQDLGPLNLELQYLLNIGLSKRPPHQYTSLTISLDFDPLSIQGAEWLQKTRDTMKILEERTGYIWAITQGGVDYIDSKDASIHFFQIEMIVLTGVALIGLAIVLRSIVAPIRVVITLVLAISFMYAILILIYDEGTLDKTGIQAFQKDDGICWLTPILSFPIVVGLGLDYDMFLLSRILAFREMGFSDKASVILGLYKSGQTVLLGGLIVAITFGGLMLSSLGILRQTSFAIVVGVLLHTVFILVLSPSFVAIMGSGAFAPRKLPLPILELPENVDNGVADDIDTTTSDLLQPQPA